PAALRRVISVRSVAIDLRATALAPWSASTVSIERTYVMNKQLLCAAFAGAVATLALAQSPGTATSNGSTDAAAATRVAPMAPADQRAKDLQSSMEIRKWQAGPSAGDQAASINSAADEMTPADKRA